MMGNKLNLAAAVVLAGFAAGTIDIGAASLINWRNPLFICQAIASGVFGRASFEGGTTTVVAGLLLQWGMSLVIAAIYIFASGWFPLLKRQWIAGGLAYGAGIFFVMNYVVVPLSAVRRIPHFTADAFVENMLAMLVFGLIVASCARSAAARAPQATPVW